MGEDRYPAWASGLVVGCRSPDVAGAGGDAAGVLIGEPDHGSFTRYHYIERDSSCRKSFRTRLFVRDSSDSTVKDVTLIQDFYSAGCQSGGVAGVDAVGRHVDSTEA